MNYYISFSHNKITIYITQEDRQYRYNYRLADERAVIKFIFNRIDFYRYKTEIVQY